MLFSPESAGEGASTLIGDLARVTWAAVALGLAYGLLTMALIQWIKDIFLRSRFNRQQFDRWFGAAGPAGGAQTSSWWQGPGQSAAQSGTAQWGAGQSAAAQSPWGPPDAWAPEPGHGDPRADLLRMAAAGDEDALFGLPIEKMAGQINVAAGAAIESPRRHAALLQALAGSIPEADLRLMFETDPDLLRQPEQDRLRYAYADARTRVSHHVQRSIDVLQLSAAQRWTRLNRWLSLGISLGIGLAPVYLLPWLPRHYGVLRIGIVLPVSLVLSLIGGALAPVLRDLLPRGGTAE